MQDSSGLAVPGAEIKATQTQTGLVRIATSGGDGTYILTNLPIGPYQLQVSKEGFSTYVQSSILLQVNSNPSITVQLKLGQVTEQVQVQANVSVVETQNTGIGQVIDNQRVVDLPLNGRQPQELLLLSGPAVSMGSPEGNGHNYPAIGVAVAGGNVLSVQYVLDGAQHEGIEAFTPLPIPFPDALEEFKVETSSTSARYGVHAGATVNMVTKSGTNEVHGDVFEFLRNGDLNARNFFAAQRDTLKRNQFGGVVGGAVKKNQLFYFGGYQGTIVRTDPGTAVAVIPTAAMLSGNFTTFAAPASAGGCQSRQVNLAAPFINNQLAPALISPIALKIASWLPARPVPNACGQVTYGFPLQQDEKQILAKVDFQKSAKHQMFARFFTGRYSVPLPVQDGTKDLLGNLSGFNGQSNMADTGLIGDTYLISPTIVSSFRASAQYIPNNNWEPTTAPPRAVGINVNPILGQVPFFGFSIGGSIAVQTPGGTDYRGPQQVGQIAEDIDMTKGDQQMAFGVSWAHIAYNYTSTRLDNGEFSFSGIETGLGLADFIAGLPASFSQGYGSEVYQRGNNLGLYIQDSWKATHRLTLNYGLRWEPFLPSHAQASHPWVEQFDMSNFVNNVHSTVYPNAPAGLIFPGDQQWPYGLAITNKDFKNFAPRVGIVWDPRGKAKEVIRAGYGIFYDFPSYEFLLNMSNSAPFGGAITLTNPSFADPYTGYPGGDPFPFSQGSKNVAFPLYGPYETESPNMPTVYVQQWNLSVQRQFGSDWSVTVMYLGNKTTHQWIENELNPAVYFPGNNCIINGTFYSTCSSSGNINQRRLFSLLNFSQGQYYGGMETTFPAGNATYEGLVTTVQKRFSGNMSALINYTWSHCIDIAEPGVDNNHYDGQDPFNFNSSRGDCSYDIRNLFSSSFVFTSPKFSNSLLQKVVGDWQFSPIFRMQSGLPVNPLSGVDNALNGTSGIERPNLICDPDLSGSAQSINEWFNTACFVPNATGHLGNAGKNSLRGPSQTIVNVALVRRFAIRERQSIEVRGEAFNLPNRVNLGQPNASINSSLFGKITSTVQNGVSPSTSSAGDPRILQFALKYVF